MGCPILSLWRHKRPGPTAARVRRIINYERTTKSGDDDFAAAMAGAMKREIKTLEMGLRWTRPCRDDLCF